MKLTVLERFTLLGVLPAEGNFVTLKIVRKLREALAFTEKEIKDLEMMVEGERTKWNPAKDVPRDVEIGEMATDMIVKALKKLDDTNKLTEQHMSVYEKFIKG